MAIDRPSVATEETSIARTPWKLPASGSFLGAAYPIMLGEGRQLRIQFDWFNVFNKQRAIRQNETLRTNSGISGANFIQFPNPFFGQGTIFQYPSSIRLGIKFQF